MCGSRMSMIAGAVLSVLLLGSCDLFQSVQNRLLSIDYYHVRFDPPAGAGSAVRAALAAAWRAQVRAVASDVAQSVAANDVYGDEALWDPILTSPTNATVAGCRAKNTDSKSMKVSPGQGEIGQVQIVANSGDLTHGEIPGRGPCDVDVPRKLRTLNIALGPLPAGTPQSTFQTFDARLGPPGNDDAWTPTDLSKLTATFDSGSGTGAAQFTGLLVQKSQGWENDFEEVIIVPRGSYFGEVKLLGN